VNEEINSCIIDGKFYVNKAELGYIIIIIIFSKTALFEPWPSEDSARIIYSWLYFSYFFPSQL
jgi:hypothetical protein